MDFISSVEQKQELLSVEQFEHHLKEWSQQNEDKDAVYHKLLQSLKRANEDVNHLTLNLKSETTSRLQYQIQHDDLEAKNKAYEKQIARGSYVIVLVDGDGAKFEDSLMRDTENGGSKAAIKLKQQIDGELKKAQLEDNMEVFVRVYANFQGLGKILRQAGLVRCTEDLGAFARGFTNAWAGFDFIDVGYGKENADNKINHLLKWHYMDERCKRLFFVACHDAGYVHNLRPLLDENKDRIVLVETTPAEPAFKTLGLSLTRFDVFRDVPIEAREGPHTLTSPFKRTVNQDVLAAPSQPSVVAAARPQHLASLEGQPVSYAKIGGDDKLPNVIVTSKGSKRNPTIVNLNEDGNRIDTPIKDSSNREARISYGKKLAMAKKNAFCNRQYLEGACEWGASCNMEHAMMLTSEELEVLRFKARTGPCPQGPTCIDALCSRGHHCPMDPSCHRRECLFLRSNFGDMHLSKAKMKIVKRLT